MSAPAALVAGAMAAVLLAGCGGTPRDARVGAAGADGSGVPPGAGKAEFQAALADMEPTQLTLQSANSATSHGGKRDSKLGEDLEEWSGGKITTEVVYNNGVIQAEEADDALVDGRLDLHMYVPFLSPSEYPLNGGLMVEATTSRDSSAVAGSLAAHAALNQVAWESEEVVQEFESRGMTMLTPVTSANNTVIACAEPLTSLEDLKGTSVRVGSAAHYQQIKALGATPVSVPFIELYESLQRGIVDCLLIGATTLNTSGGLLEVAPYLMAPKGADFAATPGTMVAGGAWPTLPLAARQLIFDLATEQYIEAAYSAAGPELAEVVEIAEKSGGGVHPFDKDVSTALAEANEEMSASWEDTPLLDGPDFRNRMRKAEETWLGIVQEHGHSRDTALPDFTDWHGKGEDADRDAYTTAYHELISDPNRPS